MTSSVCFEPEGSSSGKRLYVQVWYIVVGRDSTIGMATRYGLDGPGIESQWGARFFAHVQTGPGAHPAGGYRVFLGGKAAGAWR